MLAREMRELEQKVISDGRVDTPELDTLRRALYADGTIDRPAADFLVGLYKRVTRRSPAFEKFFYQAVKDHILANGKIGPGEVTWLRQMLDHDGTIADEERKFLHRLRGEAREVGPEFEKLFAEVEKLPPERRTSG